MRLLKSPEEEMVNILEELKVSNFENFLDRNKVPIALALMGLILMGIGVLLYRNGIFSSSSNIEILEDAKESQDSDSELVVEISGAIEKPGVYKLKNGSRVEDLLILSGGFSADADRDWVEKMVNRAARIVDGQKLVIPSKDERSEVDTAKKNGEYLGVSSGQDESYEGLVNINSASQNQLEGLSGIGPVYAQSIIEQRPYSSTEELLSKGVLKKFVYEKIKDKITVY